MTLTGAATARSGTPEEELARDAQTVHDFALMLNRNDYVLRLALVAGALVGRAAAGSPDERLEAGLQAISRTFGLNDRTEPAVLPALNSTWDLLEEYFEGQKRPVYDSLEMTAWADSIQTAIEAAARVPFPVENITRARATLEALWFNRIEMYLNGNRVGATPVIEDFLGVAAGVPLASVLKLDLSRMSLAEWGDAFARSYRTADEKLPGSEEPTDTPSWLAPIALFMSGLSQPAKTFAENIEQHISNDLARRMGYEPNSRMVSRISGVLGPIIEVLRRLSSKQFRGLSRWMRLQGDRAKRIDFLTREVEKRGDARSRDLAGRLKVAARTRDLMDRGGPIPSDRTALVLRQDQSSSIVRWLPASRSGALVLTQTQAMALVTDDLALARDVLRDISITFIEPPLSVPEFGRLLRRAASSSRPMKTFAIGPHDSASKTDWPSLGTPATLDAAIDMVHQTRVIDQANQLRP